MKHFDLTNKTALVTGASRGIGEAIALILAEYGAEVIVTSRKIEGCEQVAAKIRDNGGKATPMACHIGDMAQIDELFAQFERQHRRLDILVNNAATNPFYGHILETDMGAFQKTMDVNIRGFFYMSMQAARLMKRQGDGRILNIASISGIRPGLNQAAYSISKAAIINMTESFAKECGEFGIRVNAIAPGLTATKFASTLTNDADVMARVRNQIALRREAQPNEMAAAALYLVSDASSYTTGACLVIDGGSLLV